MRRSSSLLTLIALAIGTALAGPAEAQRQRFPADLLGPGAAPIRELDVAAAIETASRDSIVALARAQLGKRYRLGAESGKRGFDCSGLVRFVLAHLDLQVPRTAALQAAVGEMLPADTAALRPGDLLFFGRGRRVTHIGIYVGEGRFVHASSAAGRVVESFVHRPPHPRIAPWMGARRLTLAPDWTSEWTRVDELTAAADSAVDSGASEG